MKKNEWILLSVLLGISLICWMAYGFFSGKAAVSVQVSVSGQVIDTLDLKQDNTITIEGNNGGSNLLVIEQGSAYMEKASCPDQLCVHQGAISHSGQSIVCLPNQVVITITGLDK